MSQPEKSDSYANWPTLGEKDWYVFAICLAIGAIISTFFSGAWVFSASTVPEMKQRIDVLTPFGAIYLAIMTFCTVAWRGMVTSRQADQQKRQNDANDEANYSKLLQEAAKLIAEKEKIPQVVAGISTLEILLTEPQKRFAVEAMDLLADLLIDTHGKPVFATVNRATLRALETGERMGVWSRVSARLEKPTESTRYENHWPRIAGMRSLTLVGGTLTHKVHQALEGSLRQLQKVRLEECEIDKKLFFSECLFSSCKIKFVSEIDLERNTFKDCDFSGCTIRTYGVLDTPDMKERRNYYRPENPPRDTDGKQLTDIFISHDEYKALIEDDIPF